MRSASTQGRTKKIPVTQVINTRLEDQMPDIVIPIIKAIELQFVQHLTYELVHVSAFYADQCQIFAKQTDKLLQQVRVLRQQMQTVDNEEEDEKSDQIVIKPRIKTKTKTKKVKRRERVREDEDEEEEEEEEDEEGEEEDEEDKEMQKRRTAKIKRRKNQQELDKRKEREYDERADEDDVIEVEDDEDYSKNKDKKEDDQNENEDTQDKKKQTNKKGHGIPRPPSANALTRLRATFEKDQRVIVNVSAQKTKLRKLFRQTYHAIAELSKYRVLNATAFVEISKQHDQRSLLWKEVKNLVVDVIKDSNLGSAYFEEYLLKRLEEVYKSILAHTNNKEQAIQQLRAPPTRERMDMSSCLVGVYGGVSATLSIVCGMLWTEIKSVYWKNYVVRHAWYSLEATLLLSLYLWLWGVDVFFFERKRFNHTFIMEADPALVMRSRDIFYVASLVSLFALLGLLSFITYHYGFVQWSPAYVSVTWLGLWIFGTIYPWQKIASTKKFIFRSLVRQLTAPFQDVRFIDFFLADQWTSLFTILVDIGYTLCYLFKSLRTQQQQQQQQILYKTFNFFFLYLKKKDWIRFWQCIHRMLIAGVIREFRHLFSRGNHILNSLKYLLIISATVASVYYTGSPSTDQFIARILFGVIGAWAVALFPKLLGVVCFLFFFFFFLLPFDYFICSSIFVYFICLVGISFSGPYLRLPFAALEVIRRCVWNVLRMENEHLNNCDNFRILAEIPEMDVSHFKFAQSRSRLRLPTPKKTPSKELTKYRQDSRRMSLDEITTPKINVDEAAWKDSKPRIESFKNENAVELIAQKEAQHSDHYESNESGNERSLTMEYSDSLDQFKESHGGLNNFLTSHMQLNK
ncbi:pho1-like protein [Reticulomyxa filosa]|uniref:Pho1-like protein n=1 Tax=Reticulomyxa filosa TaxID=46433 RepID=X6N8Q1_RETFI|nr:pho1-like protein [Reticulomyxa filosa]|eukprot:ETO22283.1 pho1-like protein [Reticulomyxa filosa]